MFKNQRSEAIKRRDAGETLAAIRQELRRQPHSMISRRLVTCSERVLSAIFGAIDATGPSGFVREWARKRRIQSA